MNTEFTAIIVDDEPLAIEGLRLRLEKMSGIEVIGEATNGDEAIALCQSMHPDILFLDLKLPGISGLEVVEALQSDSIPMIVFVSAYSEFAIDAFELDALDYLLKPVSLGRLQQTIDRIRERAKGAARLEDDSENHTTQSNNSESSIKENQKFKLLKALGQSSGLDISELEEWLDSDGPLPSLLPKELVIKSTDNKKVFVPITDIQWIDAAGDYMCIHTKAENHIVRITMKKLQTQLDDRLFQRIHKSTLVNIQEVASIQPLGNNESLIELNNGVKLKVSRNYSSAIKTIVDSRSL